MRVSPTPRRDVQRCHAVPIEAADQVCHCCHAPTLRPACGYSKASRLGYAKQGTSLRVHYRDVGKRRATSAG